MLENFKACLKNWLEARKTWFTLSYHKLKLKFPYNPRTGTCSVCGFKGWTNMHHTCYNFTYKEVRANNDLAKMFTMETCFACHELSNSMRKLLVIDPNLQLVTSSEKLKIILKKHQDLLQKRDEFNEKRDLNAKNRTKKAKK